MIRKFYRVTKKNNDSSTSQSISEYYNGDLYGKVILRYGPDNYFHCFDNYIDAFKFYFNVSPKCYHETILGQYAQKPKFDIDIKDVTVDHQKVFDDVLSAILTVFEELYSIKLKIDYDILVFTSHSEEKKSFHIIIDNYAHTNNDEAKELYKRVNEIAKCKYIDDCVYGTTQGFRLLWSSKTPEDSRIKKFEWEFTFKNKVIKYSKVFLEKTKNLEIFRRSLISECSECTILKNIFVPKPKVIVNQVAFNLNKVIEIFGTFDVNKNFEINRVEGSVIVLRKKHSYVCPACLNLHENENPFLTVSLEGLYFHCRRNKSRVIVSNSKEMFSEPDVSEIQIKPTSPKSELPKANFNITTGSSGSQILEKMNFKKQHIDDKEVFKIILK